jgi:hypothetical protein
VATETYNLYSLFIQLGGLTIAIIAAIAVWRQLRHASRSLATSSLMAILALEDAIARSRAEYSDALMEAARFKDQLEKLSDTERKPAGPFLEILEFRIAEKVEQYLNALDRLCACIIRGDVDEARYRQDYRSGIQDAIDGHADHLGPNTRHPNIIKVHEAWRSDRSAVDPCFRRQ